MTLRLCQQNEPWQSCHWLWDPSATSLGEQLLPWEWGVNSHEDSLWPFISGVAFKLHPSGFCCQDLPVPTHTALDEPGSSFPALLWDPLEPEELEHWGHVGTGSVPQDQNSYPQTFLRCLPNVPLKAVSIAMLFPSCRLKQHHLFCPHWAENIAYLFHSHLVYMPWLLKGSLTLFHYFPDDPF